MKKLQWPILLMKMDWSRSFSSKQKLESSNPCSVLETGDVIILPHLESQPNTIQYDVYC